MSTIFDMADKTQMVRLGVAVREMPARQSDPGYYWQADNTSIWYCLDLTEAGAGLTRPPFGKWFVRSDSRRSVQA